VSPSEGQQFATRMNSLFIEASAKTAVGVREAFQEVVEKILDTPELWAPVGSVKKAMGADGTAMPGGNIDLGQTADESGGGCSC
jgi:Ras-related protein Rab-18